MQPSASRDDIRPEKSSISIVWFCTPATPIGWAVIAGLIFPSGLRLFGGLARLGPTGG